MFTLLFFSIARAEFQVGVLADPEELRRKSSPARISSHLENPALLSGLPFCVLVCMGNCSWFTNWVSLYEPSEGNAAFCAKRETREGKKSRALHSFRASRKMPRSPRLAHKAPVLQAIIDAPCCLRNRKRFPDVTRRDEIKNSLHENKHFAWF